MFKHFGYKNFIPATRVAEFADHLRAGRIMATRCTACGQRSFPPRGDCPACLSPAFEWVPISGRATLASFTRIVAAPTGFEALAPYLLGVADLEEGGRFLAPLAGALREDQLRIGMPLRVEPRIHEELEALHLDYTLAPATPPAMASSTSTIARREAPPATRPGDPPMSLLKQTSEPGVAVLTLANPPLNILTRSLLRELREALATLAERADLRVLVITAEGRHFSAGMDVGEHLPPEHSALIPEVMATIEALAAFPCPTLAAVRGRCLGGAFELVQACDVIVAGESATFGQPEIGLAVTAPAACVLLPRKLPYGLAAELLFGGAPIEAARAFGAGLVQRVVPDSRADDQALLLARSWARHSAVALRATKKTLRETLEKPRHEALRVAGEIYVDELMTGEDPLEGLGAFLEKRTPAWRHR